MIEEREAFLGVGRRCIDDTDLETDFYLWDLVDS